MSIDLETLKSFCSVDETRDHLMQPFSDEQFTYATDGRILLRVPRIESAALAAKNQLEALEKIHAYFLNNGHEDFIDPPIEPEDGWGEKCCVCDGHGKACKVRCDCCGTETILPVEVQCFECDGAGRKYWNVRVSVGSQEGQCVLSAQASCPTRSQNCLSQNPFAFEFDGGDGRLMPMVPQLKAVS